MMKQGKKDVWQIIKKNYGVFLYKKRSEMCQLSDSILKVWKSYYSFWFYFSCIKHIIFIILKLKIKKNACYITEILINLKHLTFDWSIISNFLNYIMRALEKVMFYDIAPYSHCILFLFFHARKSLWSAILYLTRIMKQVFNLTDVQVINHPLQHFMTFYLLSFGPKEKVP